MTAVMKLCCWQPLLTSQQSYTYRSLSQQPGVELHAVTSRAEDRFRPGWVANDDSVLRPEVLPARGWRTRVSELLADPDVTHVFGSPFERSRVNWALASALVRRRRVILVSEPYAGAAFGYFHDQQPWLSQLKHDLRPWLYRGYGALMAKRLTGVFAISARAVRQFRNMGVPPERVLPFGYFVPAQADPLPQVAAADGRLRLVYVGSLIRRKGLETLFDAFTGSPLLRDRAVLDVYGPGSIEAFPPTGITLHGPLPYGAAGAVMAAADALVVPSLSDGWAAVVNEAVLAGTPVVVSDGAGAAPMVARWGAGEVFRSGDVAALATVLERLAVDHARLAAARAATGALAAVLDPDVAGRFMYDGIRALIDGAPAPVAPWYDDPD